MLVGGPLSTAAAKSRKYSSFSQNISLHGQKLRQAAAYDKTNPPVGAAAGNIHYQLVHQSKYMH